VFYNSTLFSNLLGEVGSPTITIDPIDIPLTTYAYPHLTSHSQSPFQAMHSLELLLAFAGLREMFGIRANALLTFALLVLPKMNAME
jgi:hypothetical protein